MTPSKYTLSDVEATRFWSKIDKTDTCWIWTGATLPNGYGVMNLRRSVQYAHRISFFNHYGSIAECLVLDHICRVRNCVNPSHLRELTRAENVRIGISYGSTLTHCAQGHAFDEANTRYVTARGSRTRVCKICHKERNRRYRERLEAIECPS